jgi:hypothetical protein
MDKIPQVVQKLQSAGLNVEQSMEQIGVVTGSCDQAKVEALSQIEGVSYVESSRKYQVAPPDSDIQ